jgi:hypothetical protein
MIRRWTHVHSLATGLVFGLVLDREALVLFALGIALGVAAVVSWKKIRQLAGWTREAAGGALSSIERLREAEIERKLAVAAEARTKAENRTRTAGEQKRELDRRYMEGARDAGSERITPWGWAAEDERPETILGVPVPQRETP